MTIAPERAEPLPDPDIVPALEPEPTIAPAPDPVEEPREEPLQPVRR